eukprot:15093528-Alexandrium_andersonii.AAC.1
MQPAALPRLALLDGLILDPAALPKLRRPFSLHRPPASTARSVRGVALLDVGGRGLAALREVSGRVLLYAVGA